MNDRLFRYLPYVVAALLLSIILFQDPALAGVVGTEQILAAEQADPERERVKALLEREDVAKQMRAMGVPPQDVQGRIDALTAAEVRVLAGQLNSLPAAGALSNFELVVIIFLIVILALVI